MSLINSSIKSFSGQKSAVATRNRGSRPSKVYSPPSSGFGGSDAFAWDGGDGEGGQFGPSNSSSQGNQSSGGGSGKGSSGWWMCASSDFGMYSIDWLHIESASIRKPKRLIRHPIENGSVVIDHVVEDPWTADVRAIVEDTHYTGPGFGAGAKNPIGEVEKELMEAYYNRKLESYMGFMLGENGKIITNKRGKPVNFQLADYTVRISKERIGIFEYNIKLQEIITTMGTVESVSLPENADTK